MNITDYGYDSRFSVYAAEYPQYVPARVISQEKSFYRIVSGGGEQLAQISGRLRYDAASVSDYPAVGDFVMADPNGGATAVIHAVLPRKSVFVRKAAGTGNTEQVVGANIDTVFICMSLNQNFNIRRLERYLSVAWESGASPVIVLTKADLCEDAAEYIRQAERAAIGVDILAVSSLEAEGCTGILPYLRPGKTVAFIGSSGVGKSTLINKLLGAEQLETGSIWEEDGRGRHTTTHRELLLLPMGAMALDTPGMRELGMWDSAQGVERAFADMEALATQCRFRDCTHNSEPGCAIRAAIREGRLDEKRWESYQKLRQENAYSLDSEGYLAAKEQKFRKISKINKSNRKK